jgi:predicted enzyme related to lactoylglutathione lyase
MKRLNLLLWPVLLMVLASCAGTQINLPAVTERSGTERLPGKIIWHDLITDQLEGSKRFYGELFGWEYQALPGGDADSYTLIRHNGQLIGGMVDQTRLPNSEAADISQWVAVMSVWDVGQAADTVARAGGTVFTPPTDVGDRGTIAVVADPQGALLALLQTNGADPADGEVPEVGGFLWDEMWASDLDSAAAFYRKLAPFGVVKEDLGTQDNDAYRVLSTQGEPRAGIRNNPMDDLQPLWMSYLRVRDVAHLEELVDRVPDLGGEVHVPPIQRPQGGWLALVTDPSGAGVVLQTWNPQGAEEAP